MPVFNGEEFIEEAIKSVLQQTLDDLELIVIDDGSWDKSQAIARAFHDKRVRVLCHQTNLGLVHSRNEGLDNARGEFVAFLDSDDTADRNRFDSQVGFLRRNTPYEMVGCAVQKIDENGVPLGKVVFPKDADFIKGLLLFTNTFAQSAVCARRASIAEHRYRKEYPLAEDYDLWVRFSQTAKLTNLSRVLVNHRTHKRNVSRTSRAQLESAVLKIYSYQLKALGLKVSDEQLRLHAAVGSMTVAPDVSFLEECEEWLLQVLDANRRVARFPIPQFERVVSNRWRIVCLKAGLGFGGFAEFLRSPLSNRSFFSLRTKNE
jgi:glycosyltransferase involved in cell wall biosynthesis